jgi:hypothetical protein
VCDAINPVVNSIPVLYSHAIRATVLSKVVTHFVCGRTSSGLGIGFHLYDRGFAVRWGDCGVLIYIGSCQIPPGLFAKLIPRQIKSLRLIHLMNQPTLPTTFLLHLRLLLFLILLHLFLFLLHLLNFSPIFASSSSPLSVLYIYGFLSYAAYDYIASNYRLISKLWIEKRHGRKWSWPNFR